MSQSYTPYSYQANNMFNMFDPEKWKKNRLMETPITAAEAESMSNPFMQVNEVQGTRFGSVNPHAGMGVKTNYSPSIPNNPHVGGDFIGVTPTVGNSAMSDAPKRNLDFTGYSKSMDKTFMMAALQSAIPQNDETPARQAPSGGGKGGGNRMDQMRQYASAIKLDDEDYPGLWRYS